MANVGNLDDLRGLLRPDLPGLAKTSQFYLLYVLSKRIPQNVITRNSKFNTGNEAISCIGFNKCNG